MRRMDSVNWLRLSFLLALAQFELGHSIQVAPDPKITTNTTQAPQKEEPPLAADNTTLAGDSALSASERTRRLIPYMAFYLPRDFPINQQYAIPGPKGAAPINGKHSKPIALQGPPANGQYSAPQSYMNLRAPPPGIQGGNGELMFGPAPPPQQHYLPSAGDIYQQMPYTAAGPPPPPAQHSQPAAPPLSQSLINTKGSNLPVLHLLPPGPPGPTVEPILKHRHKTVQHFPPTKPPVVQQLPYEHLQPQLLGPQRPHKSNRQPQLKQQQQQPIFVSQLQQPQPFRSQSRPKQSKVNLTPFTPTNTLPGHFIPIIYTPVSGNGNDDNNNNNNNNNHAGNALNYDYGNPTVVLVDDLSPPIETAQLQQQQQQQQEQIQPQFRPSTLQHTNNEYTLVEQQQLDQQQQFQQLQQQQHHQEQQQLQHQQQTQQQQQQQRHHHEQQQLQQQQQQQQQQYITATDAPSAAVLLSSSEAESPTGSAGSASYNPHSTTSPIYHIINEATAPAHPITTITQPKQTQQTYTHHQQHSQPLLHSTRNHQKHSNFQSAPRPANAYVASAPSQELQQEQHESLYQDDSTAYFYLNDETMTPQEKYVRYLQQRINYNKQQHKQQQQQRERVKERENSIKLQPQLQQQQQPQSQLVVLSETENAQSAPTQPLNHQQQQQQLDSNSQVNYPQHSPIGHAVYPYPELHVPSNHQPPPPTNVVGGVKQVVKIPVRTLVSEALDAFQQQQQQLAAKGPTLGSSANGVSGLYRQQLQYANGLGTPTSQYIDYIVDDPKQSLEDEQHHSPAVISHSGNNQDYYDTTGRPSYKQQPTLRLKPISKSNKYATRRPTPAALQPPPPPPQLESRPPSPPAQSADKPQYIYADSNFGEKMSKTALKLRPVHKYSGSIGSRLSPPPPPPEVAPPATSHQFQETKPANLPQYYNPPVPVVVKTSKPVAAAATADPNQLPDIRSSSLAEILHKLQASNHLPKTLTPENIDNSIKTLVTILENLKQTQTIVQNPPQHHDRPSASPDYDYSTGSEEVNDGGAPDLSSVFSPIGPNKHPGPSTGRAGIDYPNYADIPQTNFNCGQQRYKGFFGDPETKCQVWHYCDLNGGKASFLCPNGTIFSQIALTCDWWFNVKCSTTAQLYVLNERLYKYILPFTPKFPEDYSGPLVDKYLAMKFQEMEEKMRIEKEKAAEKAAADDAEIAPTTYTQPNNNEIVAVNDGTADAENDDNAPVTAAVDTEVTTATDPRTAPRTQNGSSGGGGHNKHGTINAHVSEQSSERNLLIDDEVDDISKRGGVDTFESSTIHTIAEVSMKPIVVTSTQIPTYDDNEDENENEANTYNVRNVDEATSRTPTTESAEQQPVQTTTQSEENEVEIKASPKPVRQAATTNIDVEKVEVIEIKSEGASGQMGPKMYYGAESAKDAR